MAFNVSAAAAYGSKFAPGIILQVFKTLAEQGITVYPGIKGPTKFGKMSVGKGLKPYTGTFDPDVEVAFTDRELSPSLAAYETSLNPLDHYGKWTADMINATVAAKKLPFENYLWQQFAAQCADEFITSTIWQGDKSFAGADEARKVADGLQLALIDINPTPVTTGAITLTDVIDQIEEVYESIPSVKRKYPMNVYVSLATQDLYNKRYRTLYHDKPTYNEFGQSKLDVGNGRAMLKPVDWLIGDEILIAPQANLVFGTDSASDMSRIKIIEQIYAFQVAMTFSAGFQIVDPDFVFVNDMALVPFS